MGGLIAKITGNKLILGATVGIVGGLIVAILLVVMGGGGSAPADAKAGGKVGAKATPKKAAESIAAKFGPTFVIRDRIVNLADPGGRRYLRFTIAIEFEPYHEGTAAAPSTSHLALYVPDLDDHENQLVTAGKDPQKEFDAQIKKYAPAIEDVVMVVLSSKTFIEVQSAEGKENVRKEIKDRVNRLLENEPAPPAGVVPAIAYPPHVTNVYFNEFVIQ